MEGLRAPRMPWRILMIASYALGQLLCCWAQDEFPFRYGVPTSLAKKNERAIAHKSYPLPTRSKMMSKMSFTPEALADEVTDLPGLEGGKAPFRHFSGYLNITETKRIFYWFAQSEADPDNDPLVYWTNGGPGCSGLLGFLAEQGPFRAYENGTGLYLNPFRWNQIANIFFVEQPVGVGFSHSSVNMTYTDSAVAHDNYLVIQAFLNKFPQFRERELHLSGESYAGHYVPQLAKLIVERNQDAQYQRINLRGFLVGNPATDPVSNLVGMFKAFWGNQLVPLPVYKQWETRCANLTDIDALYAEPCDSLEKRMIHYVKGIDKYALDFPVCISRENSSSAEAQEQRWMAREDMMDLLEDDADYLAEGPRARSLRSELEAPYEPCSQNWITAYLNRQDVKAAIHAEGHITWKVCNRQLLLSYSKADRRSYQQPYYDFFVKKHRQLQVLVFSGTDDAVCSTQSTQMWISRMDWRKLSDWTPWSWDDQVSGFVQIYEGNFTFATVHNAGHEVPSYKPEAALALFHAYLSELL